MITVYMHSQNKCVWVSIINFLDFVSVLPPPGTFHEQYHAQARHWLTQKDTKCVGCNMRGHYPLWIPIGFPLGTKTNHQFGVFSAEPTNIKWHTCPKASAASAMHKSLFFSRRLRMSCSILSGTASGWHRPVPVQGCDSIAPGLRPCRIQWLPKLATAFTESLSCSLDVSCKHIWGLPSKEATR